MNKPREGNRPDGGVHVEPDKDQPQNYQLQRKVESGLAEVKRDSLRNRFMAQRNGWSEAEYWQWVETGDTPVRSTVRETPASRPQEIDDDERLHQ